MDEPNASQLLLTLYNISQTGIGAQVEQDHKEQYLKTDENDNGETEQIIHCEGVTLAYGGGFRKLIGLQS